MAGDRPSAKVIGLLIAVFVLGGVLGGLGTHLAGHLHRVPRRQRFIDSLSQQLNLTSAQAKQVQEILADAHKRYAAAYKQSQDQARPQYEAIHADTRARIRAILTPDQQKKFDDFLKSLAAEHRARTSPPPPAPTR